MFKVIRSIPYQIRVVIVAMFRHFAMTFSAISAVSVTLVFLGFVVVLAGNAFNFSKSIESDIRIHVVLHESVTSQKTIDRIQTDIERLDGVSKVVFSSKDEELELMILERGEELAMYRGEENPLSHAFFVNVDNPHHLQEISDLIEDMSGVDSLYYGDDSVARMVDMLDGIRWAGLVFLLLLSLLAIFLISNAIKLTIYARRDEITIMRQVGAENWFIKTPFVLEGIFIGILGAVFASVLIYFGYQYIYQACGGRLVTSLFTLITPSVMNTYAIAIMVVFGVIVGMIGSFFTTEKYLRWKR